MWNDICKIIFRIIEYHAKFELSIDSYLKLQISYKYLIFVIPASQYGLATTTFLKQHIFLQIFKNPILSFIPVHHSATIYITITINQHQFI